MSQPVLSILIPSIPERLKAASTLYHDLLLQSQAVDYDVQILMLTDNKLMSIGEKLNYLKSMVTGRYFCVCHDDDLLDIARICVVAEAEDVDVITFKSRCRNSDGSTFIVTHGLGNDIEHRTENGRYLDCKRPPWTMCAWANKFKQYDFGGVSYSEDWEFVRKCLPHAKTEQYIDEVLYTYNFDPSTTAASTASNKYWKNPNGE